MTDGPFLPYFFDQLNKNNVNYCVWGPHEYLPNHLGKSDLDIIIGLDSADLFKQVLKDSLYQFNGTIISFFSTKTSDHFRVAGIFEGAGWGVMIDVLYDQLYYKNTVYLSRKWIEIFKIKKNGILINEEGFSHVSGFLKEILHKGFVKEKYITNSILELRSPKQKHKDFLVEIYGPDFYNELKFQLSTYNGAYDFKRLRSLALKGLNFSRVKSLKYNLTRLKRLFGPKPGFTIAFLGVDGSGKTSIIQNIMPVLNDSFHGAVYYQHLRPNYLPPLAKLISRRTTDYTPISNPHESSSSGPIISLLRWAYYLTDYIFGYYIKIWKTKSTRSSVWIFDRYYYDYFFDQKRSRVSLPKCLIKFGQWMIPEPDIILCLGTEPETIYNRKPELPFNEIERQLNELKSLCKNHPNATWIDTGNSLESSSLEALKEIIRTMGLRFKNVKLD